MIRDLRSGPPDIASPARALAFAREAVKEAASKRSVLVDEPTARAFTIAITSARRPTCKRGLAANLAVQLANMVAPENASVCVLDADSESRDIGLRLGVTGPTLMDLANDRSLRGNDAALADAIAKVEPHGISVVPIKPPSNVLLPLLRTKTASMLGTVRQLFDFVVVDAPIGLGTHSEDWERALASQIDVLLVGVSADSGGLGAAVRYLQAIATGRRSGWLPPAMDIGIVLTGSEEDGTRSQLEARADAKLGGLPVIARVPQLWGRDAPGFARGAAFSRDVADELAKIVDTVTIVDPRH